MTVLGFKYVLLEFALLFKVLQIIIVVYKVEEELLCFNLVINLWRRWRWCECFVFVLHYCFLKHW